MPQFFIPTDFSQVCFSKMGRNIHHTAVVYHPIFNPCVIHTLCRGEIYSNQKFLLFLLIKFCFRKMNPSSAKLKIHARVIVFPSFSKINSKAAFRKAINKKSSFAFFFLFFYFFLRKASICTRLLTTTCSVALSRSERKSTRWTSSSRFSVRRLCKMKHALWKGPTVEEMLEWWRRLFM